MELPFQGIRFLLIPSIIVNLMNIKHIYIWKNLLIPGLRQIGALQEKPPWFNGIPIDKRVRTHLEESQSAH